MCQENNEKTTQCSYLPSQSRYMPSRLETRNVFMASEHDNSDICLGDFGLSKFVAPKQHMTDACGTVCYAAPELLKKKSTD
eukprot:TRINITY_DN1819_c0_g1_i1.p3 TRINITY_DN1819_c0_g1~~TRINITY_DN1819_c0_g1_i1.p3  ORF type:complete len:81 (+),score=7.34 TRINITY_DN1819_c0_g1_i1:359-601(+)